MLPCLATQDSVQVWEYIFPACKDDLVKWKMEILWFVVLSLKQHCLWGQRPRKMWLRKVATALKMLVVVHERTGKNKQTNKKPKRIKLEGSLLHQVCCQTGWVSRLEWIIVSSCSHLACDLTLLWAFVPDIWGGIYSHLIVLVKSNFLKKSSMFSFHSHFYLAVPLFTRLVSHTLSGVFSIPV